MRELKCQPLGLCSVHPSLYATSPPQIYYGNTMKFGAPRLPLRRLFSHRRKDAAPASAQAEAVAVEADLDKPLPPLPSTPPNDDPPQQKQPSRGTKATHRKKPLSFTTAVVEEIQAQYKNVRARSTRPPRRNTRLSTVQEEDPPRSTSPMCTSPIASISCFGARDTVSLRQDLAPSVEVKVTPPTPSRSSTGSAIIHMVAATATSSEAHYVQDDTAPIPSVHSSPVLSYVTLERWLASDHPQEATTVPERSHLSASNSQVSMTIEESKALDALDLKFREKYDGIYTPVTTEGGCCGGNTPMVDVVAVPSDPVVMQMEAK
ncbi:hypothetical protein BDY19DRAFT_384450 [Irpex rosettiformis]|uniref:Uncharacterized protein n=1 Tax=Irpex rosettiformis TaxID=378272 RepID=A0ACB8TUZ1_9APHY|nr:hypothetical protein BDY19DRAFT_384450 [Irpex rosettiformis]